MVLAKSDDDVQKLRVSRKRLVMPSTGNASNKRVCKFIESWVCLEHKFYSDAKMLVFNWYDSDVDGSYNELKTNQEKTKVRPKKLDPCSC